MSSTRNPKWYIPTGTTYQALDASYDDLIGVKEWTSTTFGGKKIAFVVDFNDGNSLENFNKLIPAFIANLLVEKAVFVVRTEDIDKPLDERYLERTECHFCFDAIGNLRPEHLIPTRQSGYQGPNPGMIWHDEETFTRLYRQWNDIVSRYEDIIVGLNRFRSASSLWSTLQSIKFIRELKV